MHIEPLYKVRAASLLQLHIGEQVEALMYFLYMYISTQHVAGSDRVSMYTQPGQLLPTMADLELPEGRIYVEKMCTKCAKIFEPCPL